MEHRQQNADNDEYTVAERETVHAKEGETTRAQSKNYPGFTAQSFSQTPVKADGSTVVRINYHRNIISLKLNGLPDGSASAQLVDGSTLQGRFGVKVTLNLPEKTGSVPLWNPPLPVSFPAAPEQDYTFSWVDGYEITIKGDERTQPENTVYKVRNTGKTLKDIKAQLQDKVHFSSEWTGGDYEVYEWRLGGESGEKLTDDYPINNHISVYAVTNYAKFNIIENKIRLTADGNGYTGTPPRGKIILPENITEIEGKSYQGAFAECTGLTSISLPASLTSIGERAFWMCTGLTSADFADKNGWAVYEDKDCTQKSADITPDDLNDDSKAVRYLCKYQSDGGYAGKYWKKN